jgi:hypothetical protein
MSVLKGTAVFASLLSLSTLWRCFMNLLLKLNGEHVVVSTSLNAAGVDMLCKAIGVKSLESLDDIWQPSEREAAKRELYNAIVSADSAVRVSTEQNNDLIILY